MWVQFINDICRARWQKSLKWGPFQASILVDLTLINLTHAFFNLDFSFRRLLLGTSILQVTEGGTTTMIEVTTTVTEKGTGIGIQKHEPLAETTIAIKTTSRVRGWTG